MPSLPPVIVEVSNAPVTSNSVHCMVQNSNFTDVTEDLGDDVLQHISIESEHNSKLVTSSLAHSQQSTTTEGSYSLVSLSAV